VNSLKQEQLELGIKQRSIARVLKLSDSTVSNYLAEVKRPPDDVVRKILFIYSFVRAEHMRSGHFRFDKAGVKLLQKQIRAMESSVVKSNRPVNNDAPAEENTSCAN
jgi:predicted transcriptional regulator